MDDKNDQPDKKQGLVAGLGLGLGKASKDTPLPENTSISIGNKATTLVGSTSATKKTQTDKDPDTAPKVPEETLFQWQAPEFVFTQKPAGWFVGMALIFLTLSGLAVYFQQWLSAVLLLIMAVAIGVWANRKPRLLQYQLTNYGIIIDKRKYLFDDFRAYYTYLDYNQPSIDLVPGKRFGTLVSLPLATPEADEIEQIIAHMVPKIEHQEDLADKLFRRLRF